MDSYEKFYQLLELLGYDTVCEGIINYFPTDELNDFCEDMIRQHNLEEEFGYEE